MTQPSAPEPTEYLARVASEVILLPAPPATKLFWLRPVWLGLLTGLFLFGMCAWPVLFLQVRALASLQEEMDGSLRRSATAASLLVDGDAVDSLKEGSQEFGPLWNRVVAPLEKMRIRSPDLAFIYVIRKERDSVRFVVDATPVGDRDTDGIQDHSYMGDAYPWAPPEMWLTLEQGVTAVDKRLIEDKWGRYLSGYAPIFAKNGRQVAALGIDIPATEYIRQRQRINEACALVLLACFFASVLAGIAVGQMRLRYIRNHLRKFESMREKSEMSREAALVLEQKVLERTAELESSNSQLLMALRAREDFLATTSHELRTPLQNILANTEMLREGMSGALDAGKIRKVDVIDRSAHTLLALISQILDLTRARSGTLVFQPKHVDLDVFLNQCLDWRREEGRAKNLTWEYHSELPGLTLQADPNHLGQIISNLLSNALKFSPQGGVISVRVASQLDRKHVHIRVCDQGPGVPEEQAKRLFQPFQQLSSGTNRVQEGAGLGLALVRTLAELHKGTAFLESCQKGACFVVELPLETEPLPASRSGFSDFVPFPDIPAISISELKATPAPPSNRSDCDGTCVRVLIAEDNTDIRESLREYLEVKDCHVIEAVNGEEAVQFATLHMPDLVLMDVMMPVVDGLEAIRRLRENPDTQGLLIYTMTAMSWDTDTPLSMSNGADGSLSKPVELRRVARLIEEVRAQIKA